MTDLARKSFDTAVVKLTHDRFARRDFRVHIVDNSTAARPKAALSPKLPTKLVGGQGTEDIVAEALSASGRAPEES